MAQIDVIMKILASEYTRFREPSVTGIARSRDPFRVLISTLISLRTKDAVTTAASDRLYSLADTPADILTLSTDAIEKAIYPCSFFRVKAQRIHEICRILLDEYDGLVPDEIDALLKLPGVGRKTANLVLTMGYGKLGMCVDIHVWRISNRLGLIAEKTPDKAELALRNTIPKDYWIQFNDYLVAYGQNVCTPVSPHCSTCRLKKYCKQVGVTKTR